jgi:hypothetical protein
LLTYIGVNTTVVSKWWESIGQFQQRTWWFYFGSIHYDDFFGEAHISKFCFLVNPAALSSFDRQAPSIQQCAHWNCMDDSCIKDGLQYKAETEAQNSR